MNMQLLHKDCHICLQTNKGLDEVIYDGKVIKYYVGGVITLVDILLDNGKIIHIKSYYHTLKASMFFVADNKTYWIYSNRTECYKFLLSKHKQYAKNTEWKAKKRHEMLVEHYQFLLDNINNPYI